MICRKAFMISRLIEVDILGELHGNRNLEAQLKSRDLLVVLNNRIILPQILLKKIMKRRMICFIKWGWIFQGATKPQLKTMTPKKLKKEKRRKNQPLLCMLNFIKIEKKIFKSILSRKLKIQKLKQEKKMKREKCVK